MREFELIQKYFSGWPLKSNKLKQGIGDDCLVWQSDVPLVVSTDTAVQGVHFPEGATGAQVAARAFLPALSDLAAMAAKPEFFTLALSLPANTSESWLASFAQQLRSFSEQYGIVLAGGDTTRSPVITVTVSVHGSSNSPVLRSGAKPGDDIWVTGSLGGAAAAVPFVTGADPAEAEPEWLAAYWNPPLPVAFALQVAAYLNSAIDISDGLMGDAGHIARASGVCLCINLADLPLAKGLADQGSQGLKLGLSGGDDYQLCFTAEPGKRAAIEQLAAGLSQKVTRIGRVEAGEAGVNWYDGGQLITLPWQGYQHF
ncbi:thiamine-phosphate kinase [Reinekea marinisedimentorum]|uniref:Thiamine-monophosphate kinase n=1 Tax=Reinekea marinisedimentorum TaxID=230495 RepID=A0A4R3HYF4_9GAMM|nr:thiamine-phosphate kinase [Reinekea marinisedimentorum]TCS38248.1 thiamine-monophosphate kinase [Reinekea marinisedimentorum]